MMWMKKTIKELDIYISDGNYSSKYPRSEEFVEEGIPFIRGNNMVDGDITDDEMYYITPEKHSILLKGHVKAGDVLITTRGNIGQVAIVPDRHEDSNINAQIVLLRTNQKTLYNRYLLWALQSHEVNVQYLALQTGTALKQLPVGKLEKLSIEVTDINKQHEIADILDKTYEVVKLRRKELQLLDDLIKARFVEMFGDPELNPMGWEKVTLSDVCSSIIRGPFGSALKKEFFAEPSETTYKVYEQKHAIQKSASIGTYYITEEKYHELKRFECLPGDILMSCSGTMGELYQLPEECEKGVINQALCKFTLNDRILPICFLIYMKQTISKLETKGSGIQNIAAVSYVKQMPINLPPMEVQKKFERFVHQVDKSKVVVQKALEETQLLFDSLMQQYFG